LNAGLSLPRSSQPPIHLNYSLPPRPPGPIRSHFEQDADPTKLYVKNLDFATTKNELMSYFGCSDAQIFMKQGRHMGYYFFPSLFFSLLSLFFSVFLYSILEWQVYNSMMQNRLKRRSENLMIRYLRDEKLV